MKIIGLCGRSGSGKSTCGKLLEKKGYFVIDCDKVYHDLLTDKNNGLNKNLMKFFGKSIFSENGFIDRKKLSQIVFSNKNALDKLNHTAHTYILKEVKQIISNNTDKEFIFLQAPVLFESGFDSECDYIIGVIANNQLCAERIMERDGINAADARIRLENQLDNEFLVKNCDHIIENNENTKQLEEKLEAAIKLLKEENFE